MTSPVLTPSPSRLSIAVTVPSLLKARSTRRISTLPSSVRWLGPEPLDDQSTDTAERAQHDSRNDEPLHACAHSCWLGGRDTDVFGLFDRSGLFDAFGLFEWSRIDATPAANFDPCHAFGTTGPWGL
jgi:hypothetical protein